MMLLWTFEGFDLTLVLIDFFFAMVCDRSC